MASFLRFRVSMAELAHYYCAISNSSLACVNKPRFLQQKIAILTKAQSQRSSTSLFIKDIIIGTRIASDSLS